MCGIAGIINLQQPVAPDSLRRMADALKHRGPDGEGFYQHGSVGLAHTRLAIIDLDGGAQPLSSADSSLVLVANGEIYNYKEVLAENSGRAYRPKTQSDSEAILSVYYAEGIAGISCLNGMYAFALHDKKREKIILCRDRLGIKPLYYRLDDNQLYFASEIKALLAVDENKRGEGVCDSAVAQYLQNQFNTGRKTVFKNIFRVLPGECLEICTQTLNITHHRYWQVSTINTAVDYAPQPLQRFEEIFQQVMCEHMRSDVPYGLFLSGGIDSSILLAALSKWQACPIKTYSIGFSGTAMESELSQAKALASHFKTEHTELLVDRDALFERIVHTIWCTDDLMRDYAVLPTALLSERAAQDVKVVFSGEGGDEMFAGYRRYANSFDNRIKGWLLGTGGFRTHGQWPTGLAKKLFKESLSLTNTRSPFIAHWHELPQNWSTMQKRQAVDIQTALPDNLLVKADRVLMAYGLEGRVPFCDQRLMEFGLRLPDAEKMQGTTGKQLLRKWGARYLPEEVMARPKRGFYVPVSEWLTGEFLNQLEQQLLKNSAVKNYFQVSSLPALFTRHRAKADQGRFIWCLMQFAIWHKLFVETPGAIPKMKENPLDWL